MKCPFQYKTSLPPCVSFHHYKGGYLKDFLGNKPKGKRESLICYKIKCLEFVRDHIEIKKDNCIKCFFCLFGCPNNLIEIDKEFNLVAKCDEFKSQDPFILEKIEGYFKGELIEFKHLNHFLPSNSYRSFREFTEADEVQNLSVWAMNTLKFLSVEENPRVGLEINMLIETRDRGGRLDLCMLSEDNLFVGEAKVSFEKMMQENRYIPQIIAYGEEIARTLSDLNKRLSSFIFLLINGKESNLLPPSHPKCTSNVGNQAKIFYDNVIQYNLFFVSSYALWALALKKVFMDRDKYSIDAVFSKLISANSIGLLSSGVIRRENNDIVVSDLDTMI